MKAKKFKLGDKTVYLHYLALVGSVAHGLKNSNSDLDLKGVFSWDLKDKLSLEGVKDSLEKSNVNENDWTNFMNDLKKELNLDFNLEDDVTFMEVNKFFLKALLNDLNLLDLLHAEKVFFVSEEFQLVLNNKDLFLNFKKAYFKFRGLANGAYKEAKRRLKNGDKRGYFKDLARTVHSLFLLEEFLTFKTYSSKLRNNYNLEYLKKIRLGEVLEEEVLFLREKKFKDLELFEDSLVDREPDFVKLNKLSFNCNLVKE